MAVTERGASVRVLIAVLLRQFGAACAMVLRPGMRRAARLDELGSIAEVRAAARARLPRVVFDFVEGAAEDEITMRRNVSAFDTWSITPRFLVDVDDVQLGTTVLGGRVDLPVLGAPTGLCGLVHGEGEAGLAAALSRAGSIYMLAAMSSYSIEEVRAAAPEGRLWFQTYLWRDRSVVAELVDRAESAGYEALVVTVDVPRSADRRRDRANGFGLPPQITARTLVEGITRPAWSRDFLLHPRVTAANVAGRADANPDAASIAAYVNDQFDPSATWEDLEELRARWDGPLVVKGLMHPADARRAVDLGAQAVVVSNHGGRQLDQAPSTLSALPAIVREVGESAEVYVDGGVRRGSDVVKALALGARACLVGRPIVLGLGAGGADGASAAMRVLRDELRATLMLAGVASVCDIDAEMIAPALHVPEHHS